MTSAGAPGVPPTFAEPTRAWFAQAFAAPTAAQVGAWEAIGRGNHALVVAPTGSGKSLAAFLSAIDQLLASPVPDPAQRCRVVYVSPLKALAADVERNLRAPLAGIARQAEALGIAVPELRVGVRTGDTPAAERRAFAGKPPDVFITTPESLFLVLTSGARAGLAGCQSVIVDEVHALAGTKRGAHLALSLERLDALLPRPAQRIALSATVRPVEEVARFIGGARPVDDGGRPVEIVQPPSAKELAIEVRLPVPDLTDLGSAPGPGGASPGGRPAPPGPPFDGEDLTGDAFGAVRAASIWPHVHEAVVAEIAAHRSTLVFANSRRGAERLTSRINEAWAEQTTGLAPDPGAARPAEVTAQSGAAAATDPALAIARAHHGSMSRAQRTEIENQLKGGVLPAVVATSSLELGIDMGAIDLVLQIGSPPSVASGLQRIGRAGHQVGAVSRGVVYPVYRGDLVPAAVTAHRMKEGAIEALRVPANPLDVLAQQIVAAVAMDPWTADGIAGLVRRAAPYAGLGERTLAAVLDMLAGRYPSADFAELRPRIVWDRETGALTPRPGAARLAVVSGGTIPDRGLYGVFLAGDEGKGAKRVGELDEEMVYESRVGDTFTLGSSTWRIVEITPNAVKVVPAPGLPGRLPFWRGDSPGRPAELGAAIGRFVRETAADMDDGGARARLRGWGLDAWAADNLLAYLRDEKAAVGALPDDRTVVVERFPDELGDWRVVIHSLWGARVNGPWAAVLSARLQERYGLDAQVMHSDDGIMFRLPETAEEDAAGAVDPFVEPDEVADLVTRSLAGSAHFAARFREAAARALLLPRRRPDRRQPLWQQRHRAAQLLQVAAQYDDFPIIHEALRECVQDDYDVPALTELMRAMAGREVKVVEVTTPSASPFASALAFGYTAQFLYDGDAPLAERRAAALSLDPAMLAELLGGAGRTEIADLLDPGVVLALDDELAHRAESRRARDAEGLADLLRTLGPLTAEQIAAACLGGSGGGADAEDGNTENADAEDADAGDHSTALGWAAELVAARRAITVRIGGRERWAAIEDAAALRDGLGVALPPGLPERFTEPVADPLGALVRRHARTHGPFTAAAMAEEMGLGVVVAERELGVLVQAGKVATGKLRPIEAGGGAVDFCDEAVLGRLRRRSLAALRRQVEPVAQRVLGAFATRWHQFGRLTGAEGVLEAVGQLAGAALPASAVESLILPSRVRDYAPAMLDELITAGEVAWAGQGRGAGADGTVRLLAAGTDDALLAAAEPVGGPLAAALLDLLREGGAFLAAELAPRAAARLDPAGPLPGAEAIREALWLLAWAGWATADSFAPVRAQLAGGRTAHRAERRRPARPVLGRRVLARAAPSPRIADARVAGRWSLAPTPAAAGTAVRPEQLRAAQTSALMERHGILTRGAATSEASFAALYPVLAALEDAGSVRRGYFVERLGGSQFALPPCPDMLRAGAEAGDTILLAAADPANPYGAALAWPPHAGTHRPGRGAGAIVVLTGGELSLYVERGGHTALSFGDGAGLAGAAEALVGAVRAGRAAPLKLTRLDGTDALAAHGDLQPLAGALVAAGFAVTPAGLRIRGAR